MKIHSISIKNLNSLRLEKTINFEETPFQEVGLFAIVGDTGAGKTTILDAITLALYGKVHRNKDVKEVMSYGAADCYAEVVFEVKQEKYLSQWAIWRSRAKLDGKIQGPNRKLSKWDAEKQEFVGIAEKVREVDEKVEAITGLDYHRFTRSVLLSQGDFAAFLKADEKERSDLLERITGTEIYSSISKAAFTRHKQEEEQLKILKIELDNLHLLDQDTLKEKKAALKEKEKAGKHQKAVLDEKRAAILWWENLELLEKKLRETELEISKLKQTETDLAPALKRLEAHKKTIPLQASLTKLAESELAVESLEKDIAKLADLQSTLQSQQVKFVTDCQKSEEAYQSIQATEKEQFPIIDKVIQLDIEIIEKQLPIQDREKELNISQQKATKAGERVAQLKEQIADQKNKLGAVSNWLKENEELQKLPNEFQAIRDLFYGAGKIFNDKKTIADKLNIAETSLKKQVAIAEALNVEIQQKQQTFVALESEFKAILPENYALGRSEILGNLNQEIEQLAEIWRHIENWKRHQEDYKSLMKELQTYHELLSDLENQVAILDKQVMSAWEVRDAAQKQWEYKQAIWEQQKAIASFEQHRTTLKEGEACPLCLAKEHPFRQMNFAPYVDEAQKEQETAKAFLQEKEKAFRQLMNEQQALNLKINELRGNEVEQTNGRLAKQAEKVAKLEAAFAQLMPQLGENDFWNLPSEEVTDRIGVFAASLARKKELRDQLMALNHRLEKAEKSYLAVREKGQEKAALIQQVKIDVAYQQARIQELGQHYEIAAQKLTAVLAKFDLQFLPEKGNEIFNDLSSKRQLVIDKNEQKTTIEKRREVLTKELELEEKALQELINANREGEVKLSMEKAQLAKLSEERIAVYGKKNPQKEREQLIQRRNVLEKQLKNSRQQLEKLNLELKTTETSLAEKKAQLEKVSVVMQEVGSQVSTELRLRGFANIAEVKASILLEVEAKKIAKELETLTIQLSTTKKEKEQLVKALSAQNAIKAEKEPLASLQNTFPALEESFQVLQQDIGRLKGQLEEHKVRKSTAKELLQTIDKQRLECNRWAALNDLIGSADGKKFRVFAQGLTLRNLVILANQHLRNLNGRYLILKPNDQDLRLDILDTFQADNIRSMNTLSGGESFLVSLALALGLSDLAGKNTNIRSLFIDEGFGTLDENSLDVALTTLENLQASGKSIGVISHVKALKERITTQIVMQKKGTGFSELEILA